MSDTVFLKAEDIYLRFGGVNALSGVSLEERRGEILALIGPNGAGKTSFLNCINGFYRPQEGKIYFDGRDSTSVARHEIPKLGIGRAFQNIELFTGMTTLENLLAARHSFFKTNFVAGALYFGWAQDEEVKQRRIVEEIIDFLDLQPVRKKVVGALAYGVRKRVELARALALEPKLLLLDEPMAGMNLEEKEDMARYILDIQEEMGITVLLVEHDMGVVMDISDRIVVLDFGRKIAEGTPQEIESNPEVIKAYLGVEEKAGAG